MQSYIFIKVNLDVRKEGFGKDVQSQTGFETRNIPRGTETTTFFVDIVVNIVSFACEKKVKKTPCSYADTLVSSVIEVKDFIVEGGRQDTAEWREYFCSDW